MGMGRSQVRRWWCEGWLVAALWAGSGCQQPPVPPPITVDGRRALQVVGELVALGPRPAGSAAAQRTAEYIMAKARESGYAPELREWQEETAVGNRTFRNVYATLPGHGRQFVVVASHYDTKEVAGARDFAGANDGGSSTGLLLELMRALKAAGPWPGPELRFVFFDGEECLRQYGPQDGLHGSRHLVTELRQAGTLSRCRAMLLLDMVGDRDLVLTPPGNCSRWLMQRLQAVAERQGVTAHLGWFAGGDIQDDHTPFAEAEVPTLNLIDFNYGPQNTWWHTAEDTLDKLSAESLGLAGNLTAGLLQDLSQP